MLGTTPLQIHVPPDSVKNKACLHAHHDAVNNALLDREIIIAQIKHADDPGEKRSHDEDDMYVRLPYKDCRRY